MVARGRQAVAAAPREASRFDAACQSKSASAWATDHGASGKITAVLLCPWRPQHLRVGEVATTGATPRVVAVGRAATTSQQVDLVDGPAPPAGAADLFGSLRARRWPQESGAAGDRLAKAGPALPTDVDDAHARQQPVPDRKAVGRTRTAERSQHAAGCQPKGRTRQQGLAEERRHGEAHGAPSARKRSVPAALARWSRMWPQQVHPTMAHRKGMSAEQADD
ncbi:hypothetical protein FQR65_LT20818 [Abscondita terminalis]|nr:hypothetical protein FQR65_LT20818 [Abscondita terminalis]